MKRITLSLVIVLMLVMMALLAANLPPASALPDPLHMECDVSPNVTKVGQENNYYAAADGGVEPYDWLWTIDGTELVSFNNTVAYIHITHTFNETGVYEVCVTVTDDSENKYGPCCTNVTVIGPSLTIAKKDTPDPVNAGGTLNYTITVTNNGSASATNVTIVDDYDEAVLNITDADGGDDDGYTITWNGGLNITAGGFFSCNISATVSPTAIGGYIFNTANVTCAEGVSNSISINTTVIGALNLTCDVEPNPTKVGHETNFTANATGGVGNYSWSWTVNGTWAADFQNATYNFTGDGNYTVPVCVNVTDSSEPKQEKRCCTNVTVNPALTLECGDPDPDPTTLGNVTNFTANASGGVPPYSWLWTADDGWSAAVQNTTGVQNTTHAFNTTGIHDVCVNVTDSLGNNEQCCTNVTVTEDLSLGCNITPNPTKVGHVTNFTAVASGGVPPYDWLWTIDGIPGPTTQNATHNFTAVGNYTVCVNVTDSLSAKEQCCTNVMVNDRLNMECDVGPTTTQVGNAINGTAAASGGVPPYDWLWTVNGTELASFNNTASTNITHAFNETGVYEVCVNVIDYLGNEHPCCTNVTVIGALNLTCDVSPNPTKVGHETNFTANATGGVGNYSWLWTIDGIPGPTTQNATHNFTAAGNRTVCVTVTDSSEPKQEKQCCTNVTVNPPLTMECDVDPTTTKVGNAINGMAAASGGVGNYSWLWTIDGEPLVSFNNTASTNITHTFNETGVYEVCVNVTDSLGNNEQCCTNVTVNPAISLVLLPATATNFVDTIHDLTATLYDQFDGPMPFVNLTWSISGVGNFSGTPGGITNGVGQAGAVIISSVSGTSTVKCEVAGNTSVYDTATKVWTARVPPRGGGGGGCPPIKYLTVDWDGNNVTQRLLGNDELSLDLLGPSPDGCHSLWLEQGTNAPNVDGETYYLIVIRELELGDIPPLPENTIAIVAVSITPTGAVFNKDIILTLCFDQLPENALEGTLTVAYYDGVSGVWVPLKSTQGERDGMLTISAALRHFTIFAVLVELAPPPPPPAHFVASGLSIETSVERIWETVTFVTKTGESVDISANIANDGGQGGTYTVELKLDGEAVDTEIVTLGAGQSQQVSFTVSGLDYGQHEVEVDGLSDEFTTSRTITWWLIIVIIVAIGLIIWGVIWFRRRRKAHQAA